MMKKYYLLGVILLLPKIYFGQIGIDTPNPLQTVHVDASHNNSGTSEDKYNDDVVITSDGKMGIGNINPVTRLDLRNSSNNNTIGIGKTSQTASVAKGGALQYDNVLKYSNGNTWVDLPSKPADALVYASKATTQTIAYNSFVNITGWSVSTDYTNSFSNGVFTAPKTGAYIASLNIALNSAKIAYNTWVEITLKSNTSNGIPEYRCVYSYPGYVGNDISNVVSGNCTGIFYLNQGETITPQIFQNLQNSSTSGSRTILPDANYNTLTISGL